MRILFARHGESEANLQGIISNRNLPHKLTPKGIVQAKAMAEKLTITSNLKIICSSPIPRAIETAGIVAEWFGLPISVYDALREFDCGGMEGRGDQAAWLAHQEVIHAWENDHNLDRFIPPDGERFTDMRIRFVPFIQNLIANYQYLDGDILLVSHGGLLHRMLPLIMINIDLAFIRKNPLGTCDLVFSRPKNGALECIQWGYGTTY
jgi:broad specificity phosphatase PhoE